MTVFALIVAHSRNGVIGRNGTMPWHIPADLKFFKATTSGFPVVMGWNTWLSIGRPLPKRRNIIISSQHDAPRADIEVVPSLEAARNLLKNEAKAFIIGGAFTYREALPLVSEAFVTEIDQEFPGDTYFSIPDPQNWHVETLSRFEDGGCTGRFTKWIRKTVAI